MEGLAHLPEGQAQTYLDSDHNLRRDAPVASPLDPDTLQALGFIGRRIELDPILLLITSRDRQAIPNAIADLPSLHLGRLNTAESARLVNLVTPSISESVRDSVRINTEGFWIFLEHFEPGKTEREILAHCEKYFVEEGCGRLTMDMVLVGDRGAALPEFKIAGGYRIKETDMVLPSLEIAGAGGHWVEVSRAICAGKPSDETKQMMEAYVEYYDAARAALRDGATAHDVHRAVSKGFVDRGFKLGHVTGHSIGMTMIEWPKIGEGDETELRSNMVFSMHPHAISQDGKACLYMQDTWLVTADGGVPLADLPMRIFDGTEARP